MDPCPRSFRSPVSAGRASFRAVARMCVLLLALALLGASHGRAQEARERIAFVVGNTGHDGAAALPDAGRAAREIATALERQGVEVSLLLNADAATFSAAFESFARRAEAAALALVYFGGYGLRAGGSDYLLPTDLVPENVAAVQARAIRLDGLIARLETGDRPAVLILDASHALDLPAGGGLAPGLGAPVPRRETLIALSAQPGTLAPSGERHVFSVALAEALAGESESLDRLLSDLVETVRTRSAGQQVPWVTSSLSAPAFLDPFVPTDEDFARLAAMPEQQRAFVIEIWRSQGARFGPAEEARLAVLIEEATTPDAPQFSFEFIEEGPPPLVQDETDVPGTPVIEDAPPRLVTPTGSEPVRFAAVPVMVPAPLVDRSDFALGPVAQARVAAVAAAPDPTPVRLATAKAAINLSAVTSRSAGTTSQGIEITMLSARAAHSRPAIADKPITRIRSEGAPVLLASLAPARSISPEPESTDRLIGRDVTDGYLVPEDLASAVQTELARLGCYRAGIDGIWGNGSRAALQRYVDGNGATFSGLEPTPEIWRELRSVTETVCAAAPARAAPAPRREQPAARAAPAPRQSAPVARAPAAAAGQDNQRLRRSLSTGLR